MIDMAKQATSLPKVYKLHSSNFLMAWYNSTAEQIAVVSIRRPVSSTA